MSTISDNVLFQAETTKKYDIPLTHLDYTYIEKCTDTKELEKILKILRSGDEGFYPDLEKACEERIEKLNPKSRVLRKEVPLAKPGDLAKDEWQQIDKDLKEWELEMKTTKSSEKKLLDEFDDPELPPIRTGFINGHTKQENQDEETSKRNKRVTPRDYKEWDKFDIDKELEDVDKKEGKNEKTTRKKSKPPQIDTNIITSGMTDEEKMMKAGKEKDKGNEAFRAGDYEESIAYYTRSIKLHMTAASYNNRAIAYLKTSQWTNAAEDCNRVLNLESDNIKALLRRGTAYKGMKEFGKSLEDLNKVLQLEPENKRAQDLIKELKEDEEKFEEEKKQRKEKGRRMVIEEVDEESEDEIVIDEKPDKENSEKIQIVNGHSDEEIKERKNVKNQPEGREEAKKESNFQTEKPKNAPNKNESKINGNIDTSEMKTSKEKIEEGNKKEDKNIWNEEEVIEETIRNSEPVQSETCTFSKNNKQGSKLQSDNENSLGFSQNSVESPPEESCQEIKSDMRGSKERDSTESEDNVKNETIESAEGDKMELNDDANLKKPVFVQGPLPKGVADLRESGNNLFRTGQYGDAVKQYSIAIEKLEKDKTDQRVNLSLLYSNRAACYLKTGDCTHTIQDCTTALELVPHSIKPLLRRANAYEVLERYRPAYADYKHVLSIDSSVDMAVQGSSRCQKHLIEIDGLKWREKLPRVPSVKSWEIPEIVNSDGQSTNTTPQPINSSVASSHPIKNSVSSSPLKKGQSSEKEKSPEQKFEELKSEGNAFVQKGEYVKAEPCYTKCIEILPDKAVSYTNRSLCYIKMNRAEDAEADCTKALSLEKDNVKALFRRAQARKMLKKNKESLEDLNSLLKIDPKNSAAKKEMDVVKGLWREELNTIKKQMDKPVDNKQRKRVVIEETDSEEDDEQKKGSTHNPKMSNNVPKTESKPTAKQSEHGTKEEPKQFTKQEKTAKQSEQSSKSSTHEAPKEQKSENKSKQSSSAEQSHKQSSNAKSSSSTIKPTSFGLPQSVPKLEKTTPYEFITAWNSLKQSTDVQPYADLLRQIPPADLPKVISNKLDGGMLSTIAKCVAEKFTSQDDLSTSYQILMNLSKVPRFDTIAMFMSKTEKKDVEAVLNTVESSGIAGKEEISMLRKKYSL